MGAIRSVLWIGAAVDFPAGPLSEEPGLDGWLIGLINVTTGQAMMPQQTESRDVDEDGWIDPVTEKGLYRFEGLLPADYQVRQAMQPRWSQTFPASSGHDIYLSYAEDRSGLDFGNVCLAAEIHGRYWEDLDGDGVAGQAGLRHAEDQALGLVQDH